MSNRNSVEQGLEYNGIVDCATKMWKNEGGLAAFYRGCGPQWARMAPIVVIQLTTMEYLRKLPGFNAI